MFGIWAKRTQRLGLLTNNIPLLYKLIGSHLIAPLGEVTCCLKSPRWRFPANKGEATWPFRTTPQKSHSITFPVLYWSNSSVGKESACSAGDPGLIPVLGRSPGEGNGNSFQYPCLENSMDRGAWWATLQGVARVGHDLATKPPLYIMQYLRSSIV